VIWDLLLGFNSEFEGLIKVLSDFVKNWRFCITGLLTYSVQEYYVFDLLVKFQAVKVCENRAGNKDGALCCRVKEGCDYKNEININIPVFKAIFM
jgi:hypothetical protein